MKRRRKPWWKRRKNRLLAVVLVLVLAVLGGLAGLGRIGDTPNGKPGKTIWVTIPSGLGSRAIGQLLTQKGVIENAFWFRLYLSWTHQGASLQAGDYPFHTGMTFAQVVAELKGGASAYNTVEVTIPEGFTVAQIAKLLAQDRVCAVAAFDQAVQSGVYPESFVRQIPQNTGIKTRLEGYLFPDTYDFLRGESATQVVQTMLAQTASVLTPQRLAAIRREGLNVNQALTIASIIEREARIPKDRPLIASVIFNRLHHEPPMPLEIDATVEYALGYDYGYTQNLTLQDLQVNSPYNTYLHRGLPPGPIANPGLAAIDAALHPAPTDYLFYVAKNNGTGGSYFASTYPKQLANEARSQANAAKRSH